MRTGTWVSNAAVAALAVLSGSVTETSAFSNGVGPACAGVGSISSPHTLGNTVTPTLAASSTTYTPGTPMTLQVTGAVMTGILMYCQDAGGTMVGTMTSTITNIGNTCGPAVLSHEAKLNQNGGSFTYTPATTSTGPLTCTLAITASGQSYSIFSAQLTLQAGTTATTPPPLVTDPPTGTTDAPTTQAPTTQAPTTQAPVSPTSDAGGDTGSTNSPTSANGIGTQSSSSDMSSTTKWILIIVAIAVPFVIVVVIITVYLMCFASPRKNSYPHA